MERAIKENCCTESHIDEELESSILKMIPTEEQAVDAASVFSHLSDSTRVRILTMLSVRELCVCEMADMLKMSQPAVSHHLRILRECGIVKYKKQGKRASYYLNDAGKGKIIRELLSVMIMKGDRKA